MRLLPALSVRKVDSVYLDGAINRPHKVEGSCPWQLGTRMPHAWHAWHASILAEFRQTKAPTGQWNPSANQRLARE